MKPSLSQNPPAQNSAFSEFMRNASASEQKRVFERVIEKSIAEQRRILERAERLQEKSNSGGD